MVWQNRGIKPLLQLATDAAAFVAGVISSRREEENFESRAVSDSEVERVVLNALDAS
jgi:hypothetical protein